MNWLFIGLARGRPHIEGPPRDQRHTNGAGRRRTRIARNISWQTYVNFHRIHCTRIEHICVHRININLTSFTEGHIHHTRFGHLLRLSTAISH